MIEYKKINKNLMIAYKDNTEIGNIIIVRYSLTNNIDYYSINIKHDLMGYGFNGVAKNKKNSKKLLEKNYNKMLEIKNNKNINHKIDKIQEERYQKNKKHCLLKK